MRVLWFEVTQPKNYGSHNFHGAGWQDSLEILVKKNPEIVLAIAFESNDINNLKKEIDGVLYFPLNRIFTRFEKLVNRYTWSISNKKLIPLALNVIEEFKPDVIHVFGSEWCYGQVACFTNIPVIIHMQGSIPAYNNAFYPPGYSIWDEIIFNFVHFQFKKFFSLLLSYNKRRTWQIQEEKTLGIVKNYMGRTEWDSRLVKLYHPNANYFYCSEALRSTFFTGQINWNPSGNKKMKLITVGCSSFWKGIDTILKTSKLLKERNIQFEWFLVGNMANKDFLEWKENIRMEDVNIKLLGMLNSEILVKYLISSDLYIHTAYIDNSPNSICEAQLLGIPIIATYVGGIPSLIENQKDGLLIPANDPYSLAFEIIKLFGDEFRQKKYSLNSKLKALKRHNPDIILNDLIKVYTELCN